MGCPFMSPNRWLFLAILLFTVTARAEEITIFDMRKTLAMSETDRSFRDFYLSKGGAAGIRPGMIVTVKRKIPLYDNFHNRSAGDLSIAVGQVKIIHVEKDLAVAREFSQFSREDLPLLEDNFIMIGDEVDLSSATTETKAKGKKAEVETEKTPDQAAQPSFAVDFASKAPDNMATAPSIDAPVVQ